MSAAGGPFWKASVSEATQWTVNHIPSTDSDQVSPEWIEDRTVDWGVGSPFYQTRVMGEFADSGEGMLFPLPLLDEATCRDVEAEGDALGVDVARSVNGDWNCIARCRKGTVEIIAMWRGADTMETTQRLEVLGSSFSGSSP